jgi:hypothetical protein
MDDWMDGWMDGCRYFWRQFGVNVGSFFFTLDFLSFFHTGTVAVPLTYVRVLCDKLLTKVVVL